MAAPVLGHVAASLWPSACGVAVVLVAVAARGHLVHRPSRTSATAWARLAAVVGATVALLVALSPAVESAAEASFSVHMVQHLLLVSVAAPLFALGRPGRLLRRAVPIAVRMPLRSQAAGRWVSGVAACGAATAAGVVVLWMWHVPSFYDAAVLAAPVHVVEHVTLFGATLWFWASVLHPRTPSHVALAALLVAAVAHALLGGLITFSVRPMYESYPDLVDQQLSGLLMWVPGGLPHLLLAAVVVVTWIGRSRRRSELLDRAASPTIGLLGADAVSGSPMGPAARRPG